jgi:hypothetical protein
MPRLSKAQWAEVEVEWRSGAYSEVELAKRWKLDRKSLREYRDRHGWVRDLTTEIQTRAVAKTFAAEAERRGLKHPKGAVASPPGAAPQPPAIHRKSRSKADSKGKTPQGADDGTPPGPSNSPTPAEDGPHAETAEAAIERIVAVQADINAEHLGRVVWGSDGCPGTSVDRTPWSLSAIVLML